MELKNFLIEVAIGENASIEKTFNHALELVFSNSYLKKINKFIRNKVVVVDAQDKNERIVAWNIGTKIYVNKQIFYSKNKTDQIRFLLHEFMHVLMNKKSFLIQRQFKELHDLSQELYEIVNKSLVKPMSVFLTGEEQKIPTMDTQEIISYLMNGKISFNALTPEGKKKFIKTLVNSGIFNLHSDFWKRRLL